MTTTETTGIFAAAYPVYRDLGWNVIKLKAATKDTPPEGFTGHKGAFASGADLHAWAEEEPGGNIAIRLTDEYVGIDEDNWNGKRGRLTVAEAEKRWGKLPYSPKSTSRTDGSGIRIYRIPKGAKFPGKLAFAELGLSDVELIQFHHRIIVCWPSLHPEGRTYEWLDADGNEINPPEFADIPDLPAKWVENLRKPDKPTSDADLGDGGAYEVRQALTEGEPSSRVAAKLGQAIVACQGGSRHDTIRDYTLGLLRLGKQGEPGVRPALAALQKAFVAAVEKDRTGGREQAAHEFRQFVFGDEVPHLLADKSYDDDANVTEITAEELGGEHQGEPEVSLRSSMVLGGAFVLDQPDQVCALVGEGDNVLWAEGESLMIAGPPGLGKTTLALQIMHAQLGLGDGTVLGLPVAPREGLILYLAMDRPRQIARAAARLYGPNDRAALDRVLFWKGPPPADVAQNPALLAKLAIEAGARTVYLDSVKDAAVGLSDDTVGAGYNRARQYLLALGIELIELHHTVKRNASGGAPSSAADVYGSTWIAAGTGSIVMLSGEPGDPIVEFRHIRTPAAEVGPFKLDHDQDAGVMTVRDRVDLPSLLIVNPDGLTAKLAAGAIYGTDKPTPAQVAKARRRLDKLAKDGQARREDGSKGGGPERTEARWFRI